MTPRSATSARPHIRAFGPATAVIPAAGRSAEPTFRTALLGELAATMPGEDPQRAGSKLQALVKTLVETAIAGDARAQALLVGALARMGEAEENEAASLTAEDQEILDAYMGSEIKDGASDTDAPSSLGGDHAD